MYRYRERDRSSSRSRGHFCVLFKESASAPIGTFIGTVIGTDRECPDPLKRTQKCPRERGPEWSRSRERFIP